MGSEPMSPEDSDLHVYRMAEAKYQEPINETGQTFLYQAGGSAIYQAPGMGYEPLGVGDTEADAWEAAARELRPKRQGDPMSSQPEPRGRGRLTLTIKGVNFAVRPIRSEEHPRSIKRDEEHQKGRNSI